MDEDETNNNSRCGSSQSSDDSHDKSGALSECGRLSKDENAWLQLKTITTFDLEASSQRFTSALHSSQGKPLSSHFKNCGTVEKCMYEQGLCDGQSHHQVISCVRDVYESLDIQVKESQSFKDKQVDPLPGSTILDKEVSKLLARQNKIKRRRSQSNSLSEGSIPTGTVREPISHFSATSNGPRNGTVSDVGVDRTNASLGSDASAPVQSLTRFSPTSLLVESLIDQLCRLMEKDAGKQKKLYYVICERLHQMQLIDGTYSIEEFQFMRSHYQKALYQLLAVAKSSTQPSDSRNILLPLPSSTVNADLKFNFEQVLEWSRYQHEYQELEYLAKGGFGQVYKVRNKLDGSEYAIKKIYLRYRYIEGFLRSLKEVKMLARLNHPNIVSYKAAWLEPLNEKNRKGEVQRSSRSSSSQEASLSIISVNSHSRLPLPSAPTNISEDSLDIVFQDSSPASRSSRSPCSVATKGSMVNEENNRRREIPSGCKTRLTTELLEESLLSSCFDNSNCLSSQNSNSDEPESSGSSGEAAWCPVKTKDCKRSSLSSSILRNWATLYVQMQLCERTLRQWLDVRNATLPAYPLAPTSSEGLLALNLFQRIVCGVDYIHNQGIVHHDIKPSNIFVSGNMKEVQVGDFGLSCCILSRVDSTGVIGEHHGEVGTRMYAAPEQLRGRCTSKSDLYSLGIVLLELLQPFHTDMERSKTIQKLRGGLLPSELSTTWPHAARLISDLLTKSPAARPTANDLLKRVELLLQPNAESDLNSQLATKDETIRLLKEAVASRDQEIVELRRRLSLYEVNEAKS